MSSYHSDLRSLCRRLGWSISLTAGGHFRLTHPDTSKTMICAQSPRNPVPVLRIIEADMRRALSGRWADARSTNENPSGTNRGA